MPTPHPVPARPPQPSRYRDGYCEVDYCWSRAGVYYDHETRKHLCNWCWLRRAGSQSVVIPRVARAPALIHLDRCTAAMMRLLR